MSSVSLKKAYEKRSLRRQPTPLSAAYGPVSMQYKRANLTMQRLIAGCKRQEEASQLALYRHFYSYGLSICLRYAKDREAALEVLNDGFLKLFQKIDRYDEAQEFKPWLRRILINASIDHYRKYEKKRLPQEDTIKEVEVNNEALDRLDYKDVLRIMQQLPAAYRQAFNLYVIEGYTHPEIAKLLGITVGTSKSNLAKARKKMQRYIAKEWDIPPNRK